MNALSIFCVVACFALTLGAPTSPELSDNADQAQILNFKFQYNQPSRADSCNSGQRACIQGQVAECQFGRWNTQPCEGADDQCYAVPGKPSVVVKCMDQASLKTVFQAYGLDSPVANGTDTEAALPTSDVPLSSALPTGSASVTSVASASTTASAAGSASPIATKPSSTNSTAISIAVSATAASSSALATQSSDDSEDGVTTVTMTVTVPFSSTALPTEIRTISPGEASRIIASASTGSCTMTASASKSPSVSATSMNGVSSSSPFPGSILSSLANIATDAPSATSRPTSVTFSSAAAAAATPGSYYVIRRRGGRF